MQLFIARYGKLLFILLTLVVAFAVFFAGRRLLLQMISAKVHSGICRSKPAAPVAQSAKIWSRND